MEATTAEGSFTEIAFGLNVAFAFFQEGKKLHCFLVDKKMLECRALLKAVESGENLNVNPEQIKIGKLEERAKRRQHALFLECVTLGCLCALACLWVLIRNDLDLMISWEVLYLVPILSFILGTALNTLWFWAWQKRVMRHAQAILILRAHFKLPSLPIVTSALPPYGPELPPSDKI